ncbi:MAG: hypothetical protein OXU36_09205 [Candidatus Poribacteria bacterium]|nr:hypothetical protein [Candidatus Poribacteria bacterium]
MRSIFRNTSLSLFTVLGLAFFFSGCSTYSFTHSSQTGSSNMMLRESAKFEWGGHHFNKPYNGPQNAQELMKAFDTIYNSGYSKTEASVFRKVAGKEITSHSSELTVSEIDARYPRAAWLQMLLDRGITIENFHEYSNYLLKRHTLVLLEDHPDLRQSGILDIPTTEDWETYKEAYINKLVKDHTKIRKTTAQIERSKKEIELTKARIKHNKEQIERAIEQSKAEIERAKAQLEHSKVQLEHAQKAMNSQQLEQIRKQLEHAKKQIKHIQGTLSVPKELILPPVPIPPPVPKLEMRERSSYPPL